MKKSAMRSHLDNAMDYESDVNDTLELMEISGFAWEPEEPEVLWETREPWGTGDHQQGFRLLVSGEWQVLAQGQGWISHACSSHPIERELKRRLFEEKKAQDALDGHNDELEEEKAEGPVWSVLNDHQDRLDAFESTVHADIDRRLHALEVEDEGQVIENRRIAERLSSLENAVGVLNGRFDVALEQVLARHDALESHVTDHHGVLIAQQGDRLQALEQRLTLVEGQAQHTDHREAEDYEATRRTLYLIVDWLKRFEMMINSRGLDFPQLPAGLFEEEESLTDTMIVPTDRLRKLEAVFKLWGPEGGLRKKLADIRNPGEWLAGPHGTARFVALRSELLALPEEARS